MPFLKDKRVEDLFVGEGLEVLDSAVAKGKGVVVITCHLGNGDMACAGLSMLGYPIYMVSKFFSWKMLNDLWFGMREKVGTRFIPPRNSSFALLKALKSKGVVVITCHLGHGDMACAGLSMMGYPIYMVSKFFSWKMLNDLWFGMREKVGTRFIPPQNSSFALLKALKSKGVVVVPLDQFTGPPIGVVTRFFGKETGTAAGPVLMAERAKAPVVMAYTCRLPNGKHLLHFQDEVTVSLGEKHDESIEKYTQAFTDKIESFVRKHPDQWMWIHKRWKTFEVN